MAWYKITIPYKDCGVGGKGQQLQDAFVELFIAHSGQPFTAALCSRDSDDFQNVFYYFSPDAMQIARALIESHMAVPCERPPRPSWENGVIFCAGDNRALDLLWPEDKEGSSRQ